MEKCFLEVVSYTEVPSVDSILIVITNIVLWIIIHIYIVDENRNIFSECIRCTKTPRETIYTVITPCIAPPIIVSYCPCIISSTITKKCIDIESFSYWVLRFNIDSPCIY